MDPNATLATIRELIKQIQSKEDSTNYVGMADLALDLADHISGLDEWITKGGFLPMSWELAKR